MGNLISLYIYKDLHQNELLSDYSMLLLVKLAQKQPDKSLKCSYKVESAPVRSTCVLQYMNFFFALATSVAAILALLRMRQSRRRAVEVEF